MTSITDAVLATGDKKSGYDDFQYQLNIMPSATGATNKKVSFQSISFISSAYMFLPLFMFLLLLAGVT